MRFALALTALAVGALVILPGVHVSVHLTSQIAAFSAAAFLCCSVLTLRRHRKPYPVSASIVAFGMAMAAAGEAICALFPQFNGAASAFAGSSAVAAIAGSAGFLYVEERRIRRPLLMTLGCSLALAFVAFVASVSPLSPLVIIAIASFNIARGVERDHALFSTYALALYALGLNFIFAGIPALAHYPLAAIAPQVFTCIASLLLLHGSLDELALSHARLAQLATSDELTGLANRRTFEERFDYALATAQRTSSTLALIILDIDHFKRYNDHYGHPDGDWALREVAKTLGRVVSRGNDLVARIGGEEFVVLLAPTTAAAALERAERIRTAIAGRAIENAPAPAGVITASLGVAVCERPHPQDRRQLLAVADRALYAAKRAGRDAVVMENYDRLEFFVRELGRQTDGDGASPEPKAR